MGHVYCICRLNWIFFKVRFFFKLLYLQRHINPLIYGGGWGGGGITVVLKIKKQNR